MPPIRFSTPKRRALLTASIFLNKEIISSYSHYIKKGLVYIIIIKPSNCQPCFCTKCTKLNTYALYNMRLVPLNKYRFLYCAYYCVY